MTINRAAANGYQTAADAYERGRPGYPVSAIARLASELQLDRHCWVLDVGAGTGQMSAALAQYSPHLIAVEPVESMRRKLRELHPQIPVIAGTAESIPLSSGSAGAVVCAQAFHWFDGPVALAEIARVLKPGGRLGLIWNIRDESCDWVARLTEIIDPHAGDTPRFRTGIWREAFGSTHLFTALKHTSLTHHHTGPPPVILDRILSISFIAALPELERQQVVADVDKLLKSHPKLRGREQIDIPYETVIYWCTRREDTR